MPKASTKFADPDGTEEILRSDAIERYGVKPVDLDTLRPVRTERGYKNVLVRYYNTGDVEALEQQLKQDPSLSKVHTSPKKTVKKKGGKISRTTAMRNFNLSDIEMDRIKPRDVKDSPTKRDAHRKMSWYNLVDVENLAQEVHSTEKQDSDNKESREVLPAQTSSSISKEKMKEDDKVAAVSESPSQTKKAGKSRAKRSESVKNASSSNLWRMAVRRDDYDDYDDDMMRDGIFDGMDSDDAAALLARLLR